MFKVRIVTTGSGASAVQIVRFIKRRRVVVKHIGSAHDKIALESLLLEAEQWIKHRTNQLTVFSEVEADDTELKLGEIEYTGFTFTFIYDILTAIQERLGYVFGRSTLLNDLVTIRIVEPASKLRSLELIDTYFHIKHRRQAFYESARNWLDLKGKVEESTVRFAEREFSFDFMMVFYDVTTLYFETFASDELRKHGFSKDSKSQQPQILVALMVSQEGFPISYEIFPGNTFEGKTMIPVIQSFAKRYGVRNFTVVADAAMISATNVRQLCSENINYIVGARLANLSENLIENIHRSLIRKDEHISRISTENGFLICSYSEKRYKKDKHEMEKQIEKAKELISHPSKRKRTKFVTATNDKFELNEGLIQKTEKLLGIKGYYTNLKEESVSSSQIIQRYHDLYRIEQAFRISKNDLKTRPIFHFKQEPIKLHIMICFMALAVAKYLELRTGLSIRAFLTEAKKVTDATLRNKRTGETVKLRSDVPASLRQKLTNLSLPH